MTYLAEHLAELLPDVELVRPGTLMFQTARGLVPIQLTTPEERDTIQNVTPYGGATIGGGRDASGEEYTSMDARTHSDNDFRFHVYGFKNGVVRDIPLQNRCTGRGNLWDDHLYGVIMWNAWEGDKFFTEVVPGAVLPATGGGTPTPPVPAGGLTYTKCTPIRQHSAYNGVAIADGVVNMHTYFNVPTIPIQCYAIRFVVNADAANVRGRLGPDAANPVNFTQNAQGPGIESHGVGTVNAGADGNIYYSAVNGRPLVWIQVLGWWS